MRSLLRASSLVALLLTPRLLHADVIVLTADRDNTLYSAGQLSNGANESLQAGRSGGIGAASNRRALVHFDVTAIPPGSVVNSAALHLEVTQQSPFSQLNMFLRIHRLTEDWGEAGSNNVVQPGAGDAAQPGDATWTDRFFPGTPWSTPGGTFVAAHSANFFVNGPSSYTFTSAQVAADVQFWRQNPGQNFGWIVVGDESQDASAKRMSSREAPAARPSLTIDFTPPAPSAVPTMESWALVAMGVVIAAAGALLLARRV